MKRRELLKVSAGGATALLVFPRLLHAEPGKISMYTASDANISDFWSNTVAPAFQAANSGVSVNVVIARDGGTDAVAQRALAALQSNTNPEMDFIESYDPNLPQGGIDAGLWVNMKEVGLSNYSKVNPNAMQSDFGLPWRGSQVLLAFDTTKLALNDAPRTFPDLVAWIKANPGQFVYNRPDKGGSGANFVRRAIFEANGKDPSKFTVDNFASSDHDAMLNGGFEILKDIAPSIYENGSYTSGNTASVQLLAQGAVTMTPVWSDQVLQAIGQGVLPDTTGLVQLSDLALCGGFSMCVVAANGENKDLALKLADFLLTTEMQDKVISEIGGFPGVSWDNVSPDLKEKYKDVVPTSIPTFPEGDWTSATNDGWYRTVAAGMTFTDS